MNKIKLGFIISNLGPGGAERQFIELIKNIDKLKFSIFVCLYSANRGVFFPDFENIANVQINKNFLNSKNKIFKIFEAFKYLKKYLLNNDFDLVITSLFMNGFLIRLAAPSKYQNKIVYSIRNNLISYPWYYKIFEKVLINKSFVVTNTKRAAEQFKSIINKKYFDRIFVAYNGYDLNRFYSIKKIRDNNKIIIGNVGRQTYQKNQIQLVRVFSTLNYNNVELQIIGNYGDQSNLLRESIKNKSLEKKVVIIDVVKNIEEYYKNFDIFILSSHYEGCPNVLFEAMLSKCFCIISKSANTDDFIIDGVNGLVYDGSDEDLERKLKYAIEIMGTETFEKICENGYQYTKENFSIDKMVKSYENIFIEILNKYQNKK